MTLEQLEPRDTPNATFIGDGVVSFNGRAVRTFDDWPGGVSVHNANDGKVWVGAGVGGGPRVAVFDQYGERTRGDWFAGDPADRSGVVFVGVPDSQPASKAPTSDLPLSLSQRGVWLYHGAAFEPSVYTRLQADLNLIPTAALRGILDTGVNIALTYEPIYGGAAGLYLIAHRRILLNPTMPADSVSAILHELGHAADYAVSNDASASPDSAVNGVTLPNWSAVERFATPRQNAAETWAESFAMYWAKPAQLAPEVRGYFDTRFRAMGWI